MFILANVRLDTGRIPTKKFLRGVSVTDLSFGPGFWCQGTAEQGSGMGCADEMNLDFLKLHSPFQLATKH